MAIIKKLDKRINITYVYESTSYWKKARYIATFFSIKSEEPRIYTGSSLLYCQRWEYRWRRMEKQTVRQNDREVVLLPQEKIC